MPKVSVIIPIFGVEKYIERCARSLFEQTLDDMEFIFVNDCTKDKSIEVLENTIKEYPYRKNQIRILHHSDNRGLSHARETGVKASLGEYIAHCDSDDWVEKTMYEEMYNYAINGGYDYIKCGYRKTDLSHINEVNLVYDGKGNLSRSNVIRQLLEWKGWNSIWDTLIKADIYRIGKIQYTDMSMLEDFFLVSQLLVRANNIGTINKPFYNYFVNSTSICNTVSVGAFVLRARQAKINMDWILLNLRKTIYIEREWELTAKWGVKNILIPIMDDKSNRDVWREIYSELTALSILRLPISFKNKLRFIVADFGLYKYFKK